MRSSRATRVTTRLWSHAMPRPVLLALLLLLVGCTAGQSTTFYSLAVVGSPTPMQQAEMGTAVATSGTIPGLVAAGAYYESNFEGAVYIFSCDLTSCSSIGRLFDPVSTYGMMGQLFSVSISARNATSFIVAATVDGYGGVSSQGAVLLYACSLTNCSTVMTALQSAGETSSDYFGTAIAWAGSTLLVGALGSNSYVGNAYLFGCPTIATCAQGTTLSATGLSGLSEFGSSVAISSAGTLVAVGAPSINTGQGGAFVFQCSSATSCSASSQLPSYVGAVQHDEFGSSVAIGGASQDIVFVGAVGYPNATTQGAVFVYSCSTIPCTLNPTPLMKIDGQSQELFGKSIVVSGSTLVVSAPNGGVANNGGSVIVYNCHTYTTCTQVQLLQNPGFASGGQSFGESLSLMSTGAKFVLIVGAPGNWVAGLYAAGQAYVYYADLFTPTPSPTPTSAPVTPAPTPTPTSTPTPSSTATSSSTSTPTPRTTPSPTSTSTFTSTVTTTATAFSSPSPATVSSTAVPSTVSATASAVGGSAGQSTAATKTAEIFATPSPTAAAVVASPPVPSATATSSGFSASGSKSSLSPVGAIVGGIIGGLLAAILLFVIVWFYLRRRKGKRSLDDTAPTAMELSGQATQSAASLTGLGYSNAMLTDMTASSLSLTGKTATASTKGATISTKGERSSSVRTSLPTSTSVQSLLQRESASWTTEEVTAWVATLNLSKAATKAFARHNINGKKLPIVANTEDLRQMGVSTVGDRATIIAAVNDLVTSRARAATANIMINRADLSVGAVLASGNFGKVLKGTYKGATVAIKQPSVADDAAREDFMEEAKLMKTIPPHPNAVQYFGICLDQNDLYLVMEYCDLGSLQTYLQKHQDLSVPDLIRLCTQIASGMSHLSAFIVHRDLAARNVLLSTIGGSVIPRIADFGLSRPHSSSSVGYMRTGGRHAIPVPWTATEVLKNGAHTPAADVWSFGVVMWEIFMGCPTAPPRPDRENMPTLPKPEKCPDDIFDIMVQCWAIDPDARPTFPSLFKALDAKQQ